MARIKLSVATPAFGEIFYTPYVQSLVRLQRAVFDRKWSLRYATVSYAQINEARNYLLTSWYDKSDASHLLFIDADMGFESQLIIDMIMLDKPVAGVIYTKRQVDLMRLAKLAASGTKPEEAIARAHDFIIRPLRGRTRSLKGFIEVDACGTGIMLIKRSTISTMLNTLPEISEPTAKNASQLSAGLDRMIRVFDNITVGSTLLLDDFAFCHRWRALCKGEVWARADHSVTHVGLHQFSAKYSDASTIGARPTIAVAKPVRLGASSAAGNHRTSGGVASGTAKGPVTK